MSDKQQVNLQTIHVGLLGLGTVGGGVCKTLDKGRETIRRRTGRDVAIAGILVRDLEKERQVDVDPSLLTLEAEQLLDDARITVFIEVMGGIEPARTLIRQALASGRHVITANKELMAKHGAQLLEIAAEHGVHLLFEASVAGGIPVIRLLQGYLTANRVHEISGILNGTCNYILTQMAETGREYAEIIEDAIALGYAEADPTSDVEGYDAAYKLAILTNLAYDAHVEVGSIERQGITELRAADLRLAKGFGCAVKLVGSSREADGSVCLSVRPRLLPFAHPLSRVDDVFNAVAIQADVVGELTFIGRGAGEFPTASAVTEDLTALLSGGEAIRRPTWHRRLSGAEEQAESPAEGLYAAVTFDDEAELISFADRLEAAVTTLGGTVADRRLEADGTAWRQAWLIGGVQESQMHVVLHGCLESQKYGRRTLLLPVEGGVTTGVEWKAERETSYHEVNATVPQALS